MYSNRYDKKSMHRKTFRLTEQQEAWVKAHIRHLIRQDRESQQRLVQLRKALKQGEASGRPRPLDMSGVKAAGREGGRVE